MNPAHIIRNSNTDHPRSQITEASIHYLASYYNMSTFYYETAQYPEGNSYLLEVNPNYVDRDDSKGLNSVDARWIDTESGIFIDISAVRYSLAHPDGDGMLSTKDGQEFMVKLSPLVKF